MFRLFPNCSAQFFLTIPLPYFISALSNHSSLSPKSVDNLFSNCLLAVLPQNFAFLFFLLVFLANSILLANSSTQFFVPIFPPSSCFEFSPPQSFRARSRRVAPPPSSTFSALRRCAPPRLLVAFTGGCVTSRFVDFR